MDAVTLRLISKIQSDKPPTPLNINSRRPHAVYASFGSILVMSQAASKTLYLSHLKIFLFQSKSISMVKFGFMNVIMYISTKMPQLTTSSPCCTGKNPVVCGWCFQLKLQRMESLLKAIRNLLTHKNIMLWRFHWVVRVQRGKGTERWCNEHVSQYPVTVV